MSPKAGSLSIMGLRTALSLLLLLPLLSPVLAWWKPAPGTSWNWQLSKNSKTTIDTSFNVTMFDIDLFDTSVATIEAIHKKGSVVICYFSAGSSENWRSDFSSFPSSVLGNNLDGWVGERWLNIASDAIKPIMLKRLDLAKSKGCDGVEPDNVDGFANDNGFGLTAAQQLAYNIWLANAAHERDLSIGLKNDMDQIGSLVSYFDWALNEQCVQYNECSTLSPFVKAGKAVFGVEYKGTFPSLCKTPNSLNFDWLLKNLDLTAAYQACRTYSTSSTTTPDASPSPTSGSGSGSSSGSSSGSGSGSGSGSDSDNNQSRNSKNNGGGLRLESAFGTVFASLFSVFVLLAWQ